MNLIRNKLILCSKHVIRDSYVKSWMRLCGTSSDGRDGRDSRDAMDRQFENISLHSFTHLVVSEETKEKIELILSEYEYEKYTTLRVPITITSQTMAELIRMDDPQERHRMYRFLYTKETQRTKSQTKRKEISSRYWEQRNEMYSRIDAQRTGIWDNNNELLYGLWHNTLVSKIMKSSVSRLYNHRLRRAALFGQKLVIDLDFEKYMKLYETRLLLKQLSQTYHYNKYKTTEPFDLHFTNCDPNSRTMQEMSRFLPNYTTAQFMATFHRQSYLDVFPKEKLVYLSPHSNHVLRKYSDDDIYIIGGLIDKNRNEPITYTNAHKQGIRSARLPLDENILWKLGSKSLCVNHMVNILHDIKMTGDWRQTLRNNIPQRKQKSITEIEFEDSLRKQKHNRFMRNKANQ